MCNGNKMCPDIHPLIKKKVQLYLKYTDDTFFIWTASENELKQFISNINEVHPSNKFDFNYSKIQMHFLDITIKKNIYTKTFNNTIQK